METWVMAFDNNCFIFHVFSWAHLVRFTVAGSLEKCRPFFPCSLSLLFIYKRCSKASLTEIYSENEWTERTVKLTWAKVVASCRGQLPVPVSVGPATSSNPTGSIFLPLLHSSTLPQVDFYLAFRLTDVRVSLRLRPQLSAPLAIVIVVQKTFCTHGKVTCLRMCFYAHVCGFVCVIVGGWSSRLSLAQPAMLCWLCTQSSPGNK